MGDRLQVQPGDFVAMYFGFVDQIPDIRRVDKVTPSGRITVGTRTFRADGSEITGRKDWSRVHIKMFTEEQRERWEQKKYHDRIAYELKNVSWKDLSVDKLERVQAIVKEDV